MEKTKQDHSCFVFYYSHANFLKTRGCFYIFGVFILLRVGENFVWREIVDSLREGRTTTFGAVGSPREGGDLRAVILDSLGGCPRFVRQKQKGGCYGDRVLL